MASRNIPALWFIWRNVDWPYNDWLSEGFLLVFHLFNYINTAAAGSRASCWPYDAGLWPGRSETTSG